MAVSEVMLVRHGQAQTGAQDELSYDSLSELGQTQARWLGDYLARSSRPVTRILCGALNRQRHTAELIGAALGITVQQDMRLNEFDYFSLSGSLQRQHQMPPPQSREEFMEHLPQIMRAWRDGLLQVPGESFTTFEDRVLSVLFEAEAVSGTVLVTSGGVIGMAMRHVLGLDHDAFSHVLLQIGNSSMHRYAVEFGQRRLVSFNELPHLDVPGRETARTMI